MARGRRGWWRRSYEFFRQLASSFSRNQSLDLAAQLAYYAILSIFPFAMCLLTIVGYIPLHGLDQQILANVYSLMPPAAAKLTDQTLHEIIGRQRGWLLASTLVFAIYSASSGTSGLITALNRAYDVSETRAAWAVKLRAILITLCGIVAVIVATAALLIGPDIAHKVFAWLHLGRIFDVAWTWLRWPVAAAVVMLMLACVYYFLPNVKQKWRFITPGSVVAVLAWIGASLGFRVYLSHFNSYAKTYGALGTVVVLLVWLYISGLMVIIGGEINAILDRVAKGMEHTEKVDGEVTVPDRAPPPTSEPPKPLPQPRRPQPA